MPTRLSEARANFDVFLWDIDALIEASDKFDKTNTNTYHRRVAVFKRSALILLVTGWETFIEDTLRAHFNKRLDEASDPSAIQSAFNFVASSWLADGTKSPLEVMKWAGEGWRTAIRDRFEEDLNSLHSPDSSHVRKLFKRYLAVDVSEHWRWKGQSADSNRRKLDNLIRLRGRLVHRAPSWLSRTNPEVSVKAVRSNTALIVHLIDCTERVLGLP